MSLPPPDLALGLSATTLVHAAGLGVAALWDAALSERSGLQPNALAWCELPCWVGAVPGVDEVVLPALLQQWDCRNHRLAWLALQDASFQRAVHGAVARYGAHRVGVALGSSTSSMRDTEAAFTQRRASGAWPTHFDVRRSHTMEALCRFSAEVLGVQGPMATLCAACASSTKTFLTAQRWLATGLADAVIVGGVDSLCLSTLHGFAALQLLSEQQCRPFDETRNGLSIGEAAGFALLERAPAAVMFSGGGESSDAWHISTPHPQGQGAQDAMHAALNAARLTATDIGYVNAHGTGTLLNDRAEAAALNAVFGTGAVPVSSTKAITGHTLGAAGIVEALLAAHALQEQTLPPSAHCATPDPALTLDLLRTPRRVLLRHAMSNNFGFGGNNCSLIFSAAD